MRLTINVDMDGVVYDLVGIMQEMTEATVGHKLGPVESWAMWKHWDMERDEWYEHFHMNIEQGLFANGVEIPGAVKAVMYLTLSHRVRFVTSKKMRYPVSTMRAQQQTTEWLYEHDLLQGTELCFTHNKQGYEADVVIDDKGDLSWAQEGAANLLFDQPWNESTFAEKGQNADWQRVRGWQEVIDEIDLLADLR